MVLFIFLILYYGRGSRSAEVKVNEFRAHAVISMEDHLLRQAILEKKRLDAIIPVNQPIEEPAAGSKPEDHAHESDADYIKIEEVPELEIDVENEEMTAEEEVAKMDDPESEQDAFTPSDADFEFEEFKGPDLSNLPEEIPIPYQEPVQNAFSLDLPQPDTNIELPVVESLGKFKPFSLTVADLNGPHQEKNEPQLLKVPTTSLGSEEIQHKRQLSVKKACYMPRLRNEVYNQTSRFYNIDDLQPEDFKEWLWNDFSLLNEYHALTCKNNSTDLKPCKSISLWMNRISLFIVLFQKRVIPTGKKLWRCLVEQ